MAFLFIWSFVLSGPLEIASGLIGFSQYATYLWPGLAGGGYRFVGAGVGLLAVVLLARRITFLSRLTVTLWAGTVATLAVVLVTGLPHFDAARAFDFPPGAFDFNRGFVLGLGSAALVAIYDYLGYYDICYIGDEVREPAPRDPALDPLFDHRLRVGLLPPAPHPARRHPVAGDARLQVRGVRLHGAPARTRRGRGRDPDDPVDGLRLRVRAPARVLADSLRGRGAGRLLPRLLAAAPHGKLPPRVALHPGRGLRRGLALHPRPGDLRPHHDAHPRAVHGPDPGPAAAAQARSAPRACPTGCGSTRSPPSSRSWAGPTCS